MQLTQITARHGGLDGHSTPDANRRIGEMSVRFFDRDDRVTFTTHHEFVAGGRIGARFGYTTLRDALMELGRATAGDASAAAILERSGRFYGHALKGRDLEEGLRGPLRPIHLEDDDRAKVVELRASEKLDRLRALVDGSWAHRFRS